MLGRRLAWEKMSRFCLVSSLPCQPHAETGIAYVLEQSAYPLTAHREVRLLSRIRVGAATLASSHLSCQAWRHWDSELE